MSVLGLLNALGLRKVVAEIISTAIDVVQADPRLAPRLSPFAKEIDELQEVLVDAIAGKVAEGK